VFTEGLILSWLAHIPSPGLTLTSTGSASYFNCSTIDLLDGRLAVPSVVFTLELGKKMKNIKCELTLLFGLIFSIFWLRATIAHLMSVLVEII